MYKCRTNIFAAVLGAFAVLVTGAASAQQTIRIGQAISGMGFFSIWAARALGSFEAQGLTPAVSITGGDSSALAALDPRELVEDELRAFGDPPRLCFSVNTPADLRRAEQWLVAVEPDRD